MKGTRLVLSNNLLAHPKNHETAYRRGKHWNRRRQSGTSLRPSASYAHITQWVKELTQPLIVKASTKSAPTQLNSSDLLYFLLFFLSLFLGGPKATSQNADEGRSFTMMSSWLQRIRWEYSCLLNQCNYTQLRKQFRSVRYYEHNIEKYRIIPKHKQIGQTLRRPCTSLYFGSNTVN